MPAGTGLPFRMNLIQQVSEKRQTCRTGAYPFTFKACSVKFAETIKVDFTEYGKSIDLVLL